MSSTASPTDSSRWSQGCGWTSLALRTMARHISVTLNKGLADRAGGHRAGQGPHSQVWVGGGGRERADVVEWLLLLGCRGRTWGLGAHSLLVAIGYQSPGRKAGSLKWSAFQAIQGFVQVEPHGGGRGGAGSFSSWAAGRTFILDGGLVRNCLGIKRQALQSQ